MLNVDCSMQGMSSLVSECGFPRHDRNGITEGATSTLLILWALVQGSGGFKWRLDHLGAAVCRGPRGEVSRPGCGRATLAASDCLGQSSFSHFSCPTKSPEHPKKQKTHSHQLPAASCQLGPRPGAWLQLQRPAPRPQLPRLERLVALECATLSHGCAGQTRGSQQLGGKGGRVRCSWLASKIF